MQFFDFAIILFIAIELSNVLIIYFRPEFKYGNSLRAFNHWSIAKSDETMFLFVKYLANWVAGCKLLFIVLLIVILLTGSDITKIISICVMIPAIATYYLKLYPIIKKLDKSNQITPKGYPKSQLLMITMIIALFAISLVVYFIQV